MVIMVLIQAPETFGELFKGCQAASGGLSDAMKETR